MHSPRLRQAQTSTTTAVRSQVCNCERGNEEEACLRNARGRCTLVVAQHLAGVLLNERPRPDSQMLAHKLRVVHLQCQMRSITVDIWN